MHRTHVNYNKMTHADMWLKSGTILRPVERRPGMTDEEYKALIAFWGKALKHKDMVVGFKFYNKDHLGNNREVIDEKGVVCRSVNYYPYGTPYFDLSSTTNASYQPFKYNDKEFDLMHGLNTYDYGARLYYSVIPAWDRMDPLCEKYYSVSPYVYCHNNPVMLVDPDGRDDYYDRFGNFLGTNGKKTDYIYIANRYTYDKSKGLFYIKDRTALANADLNAKVWSKVLTKTLSMMEGVDVKELEGGAVSVLKVSPGDGNTINFETFNNPDMSYGWGENASQIKNKITAKIGYANEEMFATRSNIQNMLGVEEYMEHMKQGLSHFNKNGSANDKNNIKIFNDMMSHQTWLKTTPAYRRNIINYKNKLLGL